jgi:hypothetical protein
MACLRSERRVWRPGRRRGWRRTYLSDVAQGRQGQRSACAGTRVPGVHRLAAGGAIITFNSFTVMARAPLIPPVRHPPTNRRHVTLARLCLSACVLSIPPLFAEAWPASSTLSVALVYSCRGNCSVIASTKPNQWLVRRFLIISRGCPDLTVFVIHWTSQCTDLPRQIDNSIYRFSEGSNC